MNHPNRRFFIKSSLVAGVGLLAGRAPFVRAGTPTLKAGQGMLEIVPPMGIELAGFHRKAGDERLVEGIRHAPTVRVLALDLGEAPFLIVSLDVLGVSWEYSNRVKAKIEKAFDVAPERVVLCATHTHSAPTFRFLRQWGALPTDYMGEVETRTVEAVRLAIEDLAPASLRVGRSQAVGANFNRTIAEWKTDGEFGSESTDEDRWLDTLLQVLRFERAGEKKDLLWYHFSAHPVCYADGLAGPDWPALVRKAFAAEEESELAPISFLQGHAGDVNPGDGSPWRGDADETSKNVLSALRGAADDTVEVKATDLRSLSEMAQVPYDLELFDQQLTRYREDPEACSSGEWVDAGFAEAWHKKASGWDLSDTSLPTPIAGLSLGEVAFLFHGSELYSYYGLRLRHDSPFEHTIAVGYADDLIGYLTDPKAYADGEYAATTVPKILDIPPFKTSAAQAVTESCSELLENLRRG